MRSLVIVSELCELRELRPGDVAGDIVLYEWYELGVRGERIELCGEVVKLGAPCKLGEFVRPRKFEVGELWPDLGLSGPEYSFERGLARLA